MSTPSDWDDSLTTPVEGAAEASAAEGDTGPAVGQDEWVARHGERRSRARRTCSARSSSGSRSSPGGRG